ncbi:hypothetical protein C8J57DRAFT_363564, partial [Mycena rebaudengoi]
MSTGFLPLELVRIIVGHVLLASGTVSELEPGINGKPSASLFHALSLASRTYRSLALEAWFRVLFLESPADLLFLEHNLQEVRTSWTRELHCVQNAQDGLPWNLSGFARLHTVRLDVPPSSINTPHFPFFTHVPPTVAALAVYGLSWPSPFLFQTLAAAFPALRALRLGQRKVWCGLCHTCCAVRLCEPVLDALVYGDGLGLPIHYARALSPLQHLHTVSISVPVWPGANVRLDPADPAKDLWSGECDRCVGIMYDDATFRARWTARKRGVLSADAGERDRVYIKPPALSRVEWLFRRCADEEEEEDPDGYSDSSEPEE